MSQNVLFSMGLMVLPAHEPLMNAPFRVSSTSAPYPASTLKLYLPRRDPRGLGAQGRRALFACGRDRRRLIPKPLIGSIRPAALSRTHGACACSANPGVLARGLSPLQRRVVGMGRPGPTGARPLGLRAAGASVAAARGNPLC